MAVRAWDGAWHDVTQVIALATPAERQAGSQRTVDQSGHGMVCAPNQVPMQGERRESAGATGSVPPHHRYYHPLQGSGSAA